MADTAKDFKRLFSSHSGCGWEEASAHLLKDFGKLLSKATHSPWAILSSLVASDASSVLPTLSSVPWVTFLQPRSPSESTSSNSTHQQPLSRSPSWSPKLYFLPRWLAGKSTSTSLLHHQEPHVPEGSQHLPFQLIVVFPQCLCVSSDHHHFTPGL